MSTISILMSGVSSYSTESWVNICWYSLSSTDMTVVVVVRGVVVSMVVVAVVPVGVVMGILVSGTVVLSGTSLSDSVEDGWKPSGGSGILDSHS